MGFDLDKLGKHAKAARREEIRKMAGEAPVDSNLEARFVVLLKAAKVPKWTRPAGENPLGLAIGTKHRPDFLWMDRKPRGQRQARKHLAVFIDGGIHRARSKTFADTLRRVNLCGLLPIDWTVLHLADTHLEDGAEIVKLWHDGKMTELAERLRGLK